jgi:hypothetical protein
MKEKKICLKHKKSGKLLGYSVTANDGADFCIDISHTLHHAHGNDRLWCAHSLEHAEYVRQHTTPWYNATYETPEHYYAPDELAVVEVKIETTEKEIEVTLPTYEEFAEFHSHGNKKEYEFYMYQKRKHPEIHYDYYDLMEMTRARINEII